MSAKEHNIQQKERVEYEIILCPFDRDSSADYDCMVVGEEEEFVIPDKYQLGSLRLPDYRSYELFPGNTYAVFCGSLYVNSANKFPLFQSNENITPAKQGDKWFFVNNKGERLDNNTYDDIALWPNTPRCFSYAKKKWGSGRGLIDQEGQIVFKPIYDTMPIPVENELFSTAKDGQPILINKQGEVVPHSGEYKGPEESR